MATITTISTGPGTLEFGSSTSLINVSTQVLEAALVPDVDTSDPEMVLSGDYIAGSFTEKYKLQGEFIQDISATKSFSEYTYAHAGETVAFKFIPSTRAGKQVTGSVIIVPTQLGGKVGERAQAEFEFPCVGKPRIAAVSAT